jgi:hypothetical protein
MVEKRGFYFWSPDAVSDISGRNMASLAQTVDGRLQRLFSHPSVPVPFFMSSRHVGKTGLYCGEQYVILAVLTSLEIWEAGWREERVIWEGSKVDAWRLAPH